MQIIRFSIIVGTLCELMPEGWPRSDDPEKLKLEQECFRILLSLHGIFENSKKSPELTKDLMMSFLMILILQEEFGYSNEVGMNE